MYTYTWVFISIFRKAQSVVYINTRERICFENSAHRKWNVDYVSIFCENNTLFYTTCAQKSKKKSPIKKLATLIISKENVKSEAWIKQKKN